MLFLSSYINKIDKKYRVSVPSSFRSILATEEFAGVILYESINKDCIEGCGINRINCLSESIDNLDPYSDERDAFATIILGGSIKLQFDNEGRITLPESLIEFAHLSDQACFVGKGKTFEIWEPNKYKAHYEKAKEIANHNRMLFKLEKPKGGQG